MDRERYCVSSQNVDKYNCESGFQSSPAGELSWDMKKTVFDACNVLTLERQVLLLRRKRLLRNAVDILGPLARKPQRTQSADALTGPVVNPDESIEMTTLRKMESDEVGNDGKVWEDDNAFCVHVCNTAFTETSQLLEKVRETCVNWCLIYLNARDVCLDPMVWYVTIFLSTTVTIEMYI